MKSNYINLVLVVTKIHRIGLLMRFIKKIQNYNAKINIICEINKKWKNLSLNRPMK
jgi:hypothetical protein